MPTTRSTASARRTWRCMPPPHPPPHRCWARRYVRALGPARTYRLAQQRCGGGCGGGIHLHVLRADAVDRVVGIAPPGPGLDGTYGYVSAPFGRRGVARYGDTLVRHLY